MSFADFVWSRRADWADGRSAFRPASTRCSRPLASTGSSGMSQLISCVFRRLRVVDEWNSKTVTRPWRGCAKKCRLPGHGLVKEKKRYEGMQEAPPHLMLTSAECYAYSTLPLKRPRQRRGSRRSCSSLSRNQSPGPNGSQEEAKAHSDQS